MSVAPDRNFLNIPEVALRLRRPAATIRYWRATGTGPKGARIGGRVLYRESDVEQWIEDQYAQEAERGAIEGRAGAEAG